MYDDRGIHFAFLFFLPFTCVCMSVKSSTSVSQPASRYNPIVDSERFYVYQLFTVIYKVADVETLLEKYYSVQNNPSLRRHINITSHTHSNSFKKKLFCVNLMLVLHHFIILLTLFHPLNTVEAGTIWVYNAWNQTVHLRVQGDGLGGCDTNIDGNSIDTSSCSCMWGTLGYKVEFSTLNITLNNSSLNTVSNTTSKSHLLSAPRNSSTTICENNAIGGCYGKSYAVTLQPGSDGTGKCTVEKISKGCRKDNCNYLPLSWCSLEKCSDLNGMPSGGQGFNGIFGTIPSSLMSLSNSLSSFLKVGITSFTSPDQSCLSGTIPAELGSLQKLTKLQLSPNHLSGSIPSSLGSLTLMKNLVAGGIKPSQWRTNQLTGTIPSSIGSISELHVLDFSYLLLSGTIPPSFASLSSLTQLVLSHNNISGTIPASLDHLSSISTLQFDHLNLTGTLSNSLGNLPAGALVDLSHNQLTGVIPSIFCSLDLKCEGNMFSCPLPYSCATALQNCAECTPSPSPVPVPTTPHPAPHRYNTTSAIPLTTATTSSPGHYQLTEATQIILGTGTGVIFVSTIVLIIVLFKKRQLENKEKNLSDPLLSGH